MATIQELDIKIQGLLQTKQRLNDQIEGLKRNIQRVNYELNTSDSTLAALEQKKKELSKSVPHAAPPSGRFTTAVPGGNAGATGAWKEVKTKEGKTYYYNSVTRETTWKNPNPSPEEAWKECKTEDGKVYYHNRVTKETTWKNPFALAPPSKASPPPPSGGVPAATSTPSKATPPPPSGGYTPAASAPPPSGGIPSAQSKGALQRQQTFTSTPSNRASTIIQPNFSLSSNQIRRTSVSETTSPVANTNPSAQPKNSFASSTAAPPSANAPPSASFGKSTRPVSVVGKGTKNQVIRKNALLTPEQRKKQLEEQLAETKDQLKALFKKKTGVEKLVTFYGSSGGDAVEKVKSELEELKKTIEELKEKKKNIVSEIEEIDGASKPKVATKETKPAPAANVWRAVPTEDGGCYYYNMLTKETTWDNPYPEESNPASAGASAPPPSLAPATTTPTPQPNSEPISTPAPAAAESGEKKSKWVLVEDNGDTFYYNEETGESSWTNPELPEEPAPEAPVEEPEAPIEAPVDAPAEIQCEALYDYDAVDTERELTFRAGEIITVSQWDDPDWWFGYVEDRSGYLPSSYVRTL